MSKLSALMGEESSMWENAIYSHAVILLDCNYITIYINLEI